MLWRGRRGLFVCTGVRCSAQLQLLTLLIVTELFLLKLSCGNMIWISCCRHHGFIGVVVIHLTFRNGGQQLLLNLKPIEDLLWCGNSSVESTTIRSEDSLPQQCTFWHVQNYFHDKIFFSNVKIWNEYEMNMVVARKGAKATNFFFIIEQISLM